MAEGRLGVTTSRSSLISLFRLHQGYVKNRVSARKVRYLNKNLIILLAFSKKYVRFEKKGVHAWCVVRWNWGVGVLPNLGELIF